MDTGNIGIRKIVIPVGGVVVGGDAERHGIAGGGNQGVGQSQLRGIVADVPGTCPACGDGLVSVVSLQTNIIAIIHDEHGTACICKGVIGSAGVVCARKPGWGIWGNSQCPVINCRVSIPIANCSGNIPINVFSRRAG